MRQSQHPLILRSQIYSELSHNYVLENPEAIVAAVFDNPSLVEVLNDLRQKITFFLGDEAKYARLEYQHLDEGWSVLFVDVVSSLPIEKIKAIIDSLLNWVMEKYPREFAVLNIKNSLLV
ncbi:hypothetical protein [Chryseolinea lacunae]|uniref:Uncharacterized protein n=1 Tax=Chryseolinea lacunae TaxID=2801331 RepID=A0ABS1KTU6_9BACT|nr:hypothetical protein [Chryseolinea lacunae]MBL0742841.1 hypothetical protein [Chryseolinea lacunae]